MFLSSENYLVQVKLLAGSSQNLSLAVAFWSNGAEKLFNNWLGGYLKILCNLSNGDHLGSFHGLSDISS